MMLLYYQYMNDRSVSDGFADPLVLSRSHQSECRSYLGVVASDPPRCGFLLRTPSRSRLGTTGRPATETWEFDGFL